MYRKKRVSKKVTSAKELTTGGEFPKKKRKRRRPKFICQICDEAFLFRGDLSFHKLGHIGHDHVDIQKLSSKRKGKGGHPRRRFKYRCAFCPQVCPDRVELERHFVEKHKKKRRFKIRKRKKVAVEVEHEPEQEPSQSTSTPPPTNTAEDKLNKETLIPSESDEQPELTQQVQDEKQEHSHSTSTPSTPPTNAAEEKQSKEIPNICDEYPELQQVHDEKQFQCPTSPNKSKLLSNETNSTQRKKRPPKKEKLYPCIECEKTFLRVAHLQAHQRTHKPKLEQT